jgi:hypothetical protein
MEREAFQPSAPARLKGSPYESNAESYNVQVPERKDDVHVLERDLRDIFGSRLQSLVAYGERGRDAVRQAHAHGTAGHTARGHHALDDEADAARTLAIVESLSGDDLRACAGRLAAWHDSGLATPLILAAREFGRSLDVFPLEFGGILADYRVVTGANPFGGLSVDAADLRRAVEVQARSHLLHLREGYLETRGRLDALAVLLVESAPAFAALLTSVARLANQPTHDPAAAARQAEQLLGVVPGAATNIVTLVGVRKIPSAEAERLFPPYLDAVERLVAYADRWR